MIFALASRGIWWKGAIAFALLIASSWLFLPSSTWLFVLLYILLILSKPLPRCTTFEAALPIYGSQIICARLISELGFIWFPACALLAAVSVRGGPEKSQLIWTIFSGVAFLTFFVIARQAVGVRLFSAPRWWFMLVAWTTAVAAGVLGVLHLFSSPIVSLACGVGAAVSLLNIITKVPTAFESAPVEASRRRPSDWLRKIQFFTLPPTIRALALQIPFFDAVLALFMGVIGNQLFGSLLVLAFVARRLPPSEWPFTLPISHLKRFLFLLLPTLGIFLAGALFDLYYRQQAVRTEVIALMVLTAVQLPSIFLIEFAYQPLFRGALPKLRILARFLLPPLFFAGIVFFVYFVSERAPKGSRLRFAFASLLGTTLPGGLVTWCVAGTATLGFLYWLAYKGFCRMEMKRRQPIPL